jgi:Transposase DDE domain group 1
MRQQVNSGEHFRRGNADIDDTLDVVHGEAGQGSSGESDGIARRGHQQMSLFNAHYDERCFLPIHVYDTATARPVALLLRPGAPPSGAEIRNHLRRLIRRIRQHWPNTRLTIRGDGHYGRPEVMAWCKANAVSYILGLPGSAVLRALIEPVADETRVQRAVTGAAAVRRYTELRYGARSWRCERRVAARIGATPKGLDIRTVVTHQPHVRHRRVAIRHAVLRAENLIKLHKSQLASDRTSCRSPLANQVRLVLHTAAYWLMLTVRDAIPQPRTLASAEFATLRMRLIKIAARVTETVTRVRIAFAAACPEATRVRRQSLR